MRLERSTVVYLIDLARFDAFAFDLDGVVTNIWAGRAGNFGLVVGVDRIDDAEALRRRGADIVVTTLDQLELTRGAALEHR